MTIHRSRRQLWNMNNGQIPENPYYKKHWCSTYLVLTNSSCDFDENADNFNLSDFRIEAYFTLVNKAIRFGKDVSDDVRTLMFDGSEHISDHCSSIMIGQLGKYISDDYISPLSIWKRVCCTRG